MAVTPYFNDSGVRCRTPIYLGGQRNRKITEEEVALWREQREAGMSYAAIAREADRNVSVVIRNLDPAVKEQHQDYNFWRYYARPETREKANYNHRTWSQNKKMNGMCEQCFKPLAPTSRAMCLEHLAIYRRKQTRRQREQTKKGLCRQCPAPLAPTSISRCQYHLEHNRAYDQRRRNNGTCNSQTQAA